MVSFMGLMETKGCKHIQIYPSSVVYQISVPMHMDLTSLQNMK